MPALPTSCWILRVLGVGLEGSGALGRATLSWYCCLENGKGLAILVPGDACIQVCEVCVAPAHLGRGETLLPWLDCWTQLCVSMVGRGSRMSAPTSHTPLTERLWSLGNLSVRKADVPPPLPLHRQDLLCKTRR